VTWIVGLLVCYLEEITALAASRDFSRFLLLDNILACQYTEVYPSKVGKLVGWFASLSTNQPTNQFSTRQGAEL
jgi:hypothetical protein